MSRPLRIEYPGAFYHVMQRGLERREIFREHKDYEKFLNYLSSAHTSYGVNFHTYCLMPNHYHLLIQTPKANLKQAMHMINTGYSIYFNLKYKRVGPLFQGRYKSLLIEADGYLHHVSRYIHLNPIKTATKLAKKPEDYKYSSYRMFIGKEKAPEWLNIDFILEMFDKSNKQASREYDKFVKDTMVDSNDIIKKNNIMGIFIGREEFFNDIKIKYIDSLEDTEIPKIREIKRLDDAGKIASIKEEVNRLIKTETERNKVAIYLMRMNTGYSLNEIGDLMGGITYSGISQICRRIDKRRNDDKELDSIIVKLSKSVSNVKT